MTEFLQWIRNIGSYCGQSYTLTASYQTCSPEMSYISRSEGNKNTKAQHFCSLKGGFRDCWKEVITYRFMFDARERTHGTGVRTAPTIPLALMLKNPVANQLLENYVTSAEAKRRTTTV